MTFFDFSSRNAWETFADVGTWMVIIGVAGEGLEIGIKIFERKWKRLERWYNKHELAVDVFGAVFWIIVVLGLIIEFKGNGEARIFADKENAALKDQAEQAKQVSALANERAAVANKLAGEANERAEKEALARAGLESDVVAVMSPRVLVQTGEAVRRLSQVSNVTAIVLVSADNRLEEEPMRTASQILAFLRQAHWNPIVTNIPAEWAWPPRNGVVDVQVNERPIYGVNVPTAAETDLAKRAIHAKDVLVRELNAGGIEAEASLSRMKLPIGIVLILVGERRNPFQYRFAEQMFERKAKALEQVNPTEAERYRRIAEMLNKDDRLERPSPELLAVREKQRELRDQEQVLRDRISELGSKQFLPASKELAQAQTEYNALSTRMNQLQDEQSALSDQEYNLDMERSFGTNFSRRLLRTNALPLRK